MSDSQPSPRKLTDPRFRAALMAKLDSLIAVLEIARTKAKKGRTAAGADQARLDRVEDNLSRTLQVCRRARQNLRDGAPVAELGIDRDRCLRQEAVSHAEFQRLRKCAPIRREDAEDVDLDALCQRLIADWPDDADAR